MDLNHRRHRKIFRSTRDKTPDGPLAETSNQIASTDISQTDATITAFEEENGEPQIIQMEIRQPNARSAHESKILRRRDKTFVAIAARSSSQPRQAERLTNPEADFLLRTAKRSLSSPRHKEESSESEVPITLSKEIIKQNTNLNVDDVDRMSRLERNLNRFEEERKRFEAEKRHFDREKREHRLRYKHFLEISEERKRMMQSYRKLSNHSQLPLDFNKKQLLSKNLLLKRTEPSNPKSKQNIGNDESSTQFSSSEADTQEEIIQVRLSKHSSPLRRHVSAAAGHVASVRGPAPNPPNISGPPPLKRNSSLSPIKPLRRSRTPEERIERMKKFGIDPAQNDSNSCVTKESENINNIFNIDSSGIYCREISKRESILEQNPEVLKEANVVGAESHKSVQKSENKAQFLVKLLEKIKKTFNNKEMKQLHAHTLKTEHDSTFSETDLTETICSRAFIRAFFKDASYQWILLKSQYPLQLREISVLRNKCIGHLILLVMICGFGGLMFRYSEGISENIYKCEVKKVKRDFIENLWTVSHNMREDDWKSLARQKLRKFEEDLHELQELGIRRQTGMKSWNFVNCILYCWTIISTIGYGHITPQTVLGRSLTIIYAIIGIPMFLILLADFGKLFTRALKFLWAYVRRLYYTGTCRKIRKQQQVRDAMSGFNTMYEAAIRRPSQFFSVAGDTEIESQGSEAERSGVNLSHPDTPTSPYPETFEIDDEFNLPVSVASILLISYIVIGAFVYTLWEDWTYFEAFYFVFISMSTIGFGDFVPNHPIFMMCSIIYLVFGLALTSMFINVVQIKLSDTFKQASAKIGATIGLGIASELGDEDGSHIRTPSELASIHASRLGRIPEDFKENPLGPTPTLTSILRSARPVTPQTHIGNGTNDNEFQPGLFHPKRQVSMEQPDETEKKRFFKK